MTKCSTDHWIRVVHFSSGSWKDGTKTMQHCAAGSQLGCWSCSSVILWTEGKSLAWNWQCVIWRFWKQEDWTPFSYRGRPWSWFPSLRWPTPGRATPTTTWSTAMTTKSAPMITQQPAAVSSCRHTQWSVVVRKPVGLKHENPLYPNLNHHNWVQSPN